MEPLSIVAGAFAVKVLEHLTAQSLAEPAAHHLRARSAKKKHLKVISVCEQNAIENLVKRYSGSQISEDRLRKGLVSIVSNAEAATCLKEATISGLSKEQIQRMRTIVRDCGHAWLADSNEFESIMRHFLDRFVRNLFDASERDPNTFYVIATRSLRYEYERSRNYDVERRMHDDVLLSKIRTILESQSISQGRLERLLVTLKENGEKLEKSISNTVEEFAKASKRYDELATMSSDIVEINAMKHSANAAFERGGNGEAVRLLEEAALREVSFAVQAADLEKRKRVSAAASYAQAGHIKATEFSYRNAAEYFEKAASTLPKSLVCLRAEYLERAGNALIGSGDYPSAQRLLHLAAEIISKDCDRAVVVAIKMSSAMTHWLQAEWDLAEPLLEEVMRDSSADRHEVLQLLNNLAMTFVLRKDFTRATTMFRRALHHLGKGRERRSNALFSEVIGNLGLMYVAAPEQHLWRAEVLLSCAKYFLWAIAPEHPQLGLIECNLGAFYLNVGKYDKAEELLPHGLSLRERVLGLEHPALATCLDTYGAFFLDVKNDTAKAELYLTRAYGIRVKRLRHDHPAIAQTALNLGSVYLKKRQFRDAEALFRRARLIFKKTYGASDQMTTIATLRLAIVFECTNRHEAAQNLRQTLNLNNSSH